MTLSVNDFQAAVVERGIISRAALEKILQESDSRPDSADQLANLLVRYGHLTNYQASRITEGHIDNLFLGNYVLIERIGAGGMGQVYKARHLRMKRVVAIKILPPQMSDERTIERFHREVEAAARLTHPHVVTTHDAADHDGTHYMVMEYVEGRDLSEVVRTHGPLPAAEAVDYIVQSAEALEYAHRQGVVHRDIKPGNLLLDNDGVIKLLDLGLARFDDMSDDDKQLTKTGSVMGTADFMSPEQALDTREADARSDIYSLGCTLYWLLTGEPVYGGDTVLKKILAHRDRSVPSVRLLQPDVPKWLDGVLQKMLAKSPHKRYQSMAEVIEALEAHQLPSSPRVAVPQPREKVKQQHTIAMSGTGQSNAASQDVRTAPSMDVASMTSPTIVETPDTDVSTGFSDTIDSPPTALVRKLNSLTRAQITTAAVVLGFAVVGLVAYSFSGSNSPEVDPSSLSANEKTELPPVPDEKTVESKTPVKPTVGSGLADGATHFADLPEMFATVTADQTGRNLVGLVLDPQRTTGISAWQFDTRLPRARITSLAWHPTEDVLACGTADGVIRLIEVNTGQLEQILPGPAAAVHTLCWNLRGSRLACLSGESFIRVWSRDGRFSDAEADRDEIIDVGWNPDGRFLVGVGRFNGWHEWNLRFDHKLIPSPGYRGLGIAWNPLDDLVGVTRENGVVEIWQRPNELLQTIQAPDGPVMHPAWSADGQRLAAWCAADGAVHTWSRDGESGLRIELGEPDWISWKSSDQIVTRSGSTITVHALDGATPASFSLDEEVLTGPVHAATDGRRFACTTAANELLIVSEDGTIEQRFRGGQVRMDGRVRFNSTGTQFAVSSGKQIQIFTADGEPLRVLPGEFTPSVAWHSESDQLLTVGTDRQVKLWDNAGQLVSEFGENVGSMVAWAPGETGIVATQIDQSVAYYSLTGELIESRRIYGDPIISLESSTTDQGPLAAAARHHPVKLIGGDNQESEIAVDSDALKMLRWSHDGSLLAILDRKLTIVNAAGQVQEIGRLPDLSDATCLAWAPDSTQLAIGFHDGQAEDSRQRVARLDLQTSQLDYLSGCDASVADLSWSAQGKLIALSTDGTLRCWEMPAGQPVWSALPATGGVLENTSLVLDANGELLYGTRTQFNNQLVAIYREDERNYDRSKDNDELLHTLPMLEFSRRRKEPAP